MSDTVQPKKTMAQIADEGQPNLVDVLGITETVQGLSAIKPGDTGNEYLDLIKLSEENSYRNAAAQSSDPVAFMNRYKAAQAIQPFYPRMTVNQIFNNYEAISEDYWGKAQEPTESTIKTMWDSWQAGVNLYAMGKVGFGLSLAKMAQGIFEGIGMTDAAEYMSKGSVEFENAITDLKGRIDQLNIDNVEDPKAIRTWLKTLAGTAPSVMFGVAEAAVAGGLGKATGLAKTVQFAGENVTAGQVLKAMAIAQRPVQGATFMLGWTTLQGLDFIEMRDRGIDDRIAMPIAFATGAMNQIVEQALGFETAGAKLFDKIGLVNVTDKIMSRLHGKNILQSAATTLAARTVVSTLGQSTEELLQAFNTGVGTMVAQEISKALMEDGTIRDPATVASVAKNMKDSFIQTLTTAAVLGFGSNIISTVRDQQNFRDMVSNATSMSKPAFTEKMSEAMPFEGVSREETVKMAEKIYDQKMLDEAEVQKAYEEAKARPTEGQTGTESRTDTGALRVEKSDLGTNEEQGGRDYSYDVGAARLVKNAEKAEKYGHIEVNEQGDTITLLSANFKSERASLIDEALGELIAQNPGKLIEISEDGQADPFLAGAFERYKNMKWAQDTTTSVPDESMKNVHREQLLATKKMSPGQAEATIGLMQTFANTAKVSYSEFWQPLKEIRVGTETEVGAGNVGKIRFLDNGQEVSPEGLKKLAQSVIYVAENESNANVVTHELTHFGRVQMSAIAPQALKGIEEVYGITDGVWEREHDERLANEFMSFVAHGTVEDERAKPFFERMRDIIRSIWPHMRKLALTPEVEKIFKTWFSEPIAAAKEAISDLDSTDITVSERYNVSPEDTKIDKNKVFSDTDLLSDSSKRIVDDNLKEMGQDLGLNMTKSQMYEGGEDINNMASNDAKDYDTVEDWVEKGLGYKFASLKESDKVWFKSRFNWIKEGKARQYQKSGDFFNMLVSGRNMNDFLYALNRAISSGSKDYMQDTRRAKRVRDAISKSPEIVNAMESLVRTGIIPEAMRNKLNSYIKRNEDLVMFLYAEVSGDVDLAQEALSNLKELPEMDKSDFIQRPGMTLADQAIIYRAISDDNLRKKVMSGEATIDDILAYEKVIIHRGNEALREQHKTDQAIYKERLALVRIKEQMRKERKYILSQPPAHVDNTFLQILLLMKQYLRGGQKLDVAKMRSLSSIVFRENPGYAETFIGLIDSIGKKNFKEWTIDELRQVSGIMKGLTEIGRVTFEKNKFIRDIGIKRTRQEIQANLQSGAVYKEYMVENNGVAPAPGSVEEEALDIAAKKRMAGASAGRPDAVFNDIDRTGTLKKIVWEQAEIAKSKEYEERDRRTRPILAFVKEKNIDKKMNDRVVVKGVAQDNTDMTFTMGQLLGARALMGRGDKFNEIQRERFIYGTLFSSEYKETRSDVEMKAAFGDKVAKMEAAFDKYITPDMEELVQKILSVFDNADDKTRFIHAMLEISGREVNMENYYFPIRMQSELSERDDNIVDSIIKQNDFFKALLADGFTYDRRPNIRPSSNKRIEYDLMSLFLGGVERQEHLINVGMWAKDMKSIFSHSEYSAGINETLRVIGGTQIQKYIGTFIEAVVNPNGYKVRGDGSEMIKSMRGKVMTCMLSWRASTFLVQMATSPMIGIAYSPMEFLRTVFKGYTSGNPVKWYESIEAKSAILRNRQLDPFIGNLKNLYERGALGHQTEWMAEYGFRFLNFADRFSCAIVWETIYQDNLKKSKEDGSPAMSSEEAAHQADMVILQTQPTSDDMFRSPLYRNVESWKAVLLQFTQPLNVIWNQLRYDVPAAFREKQWGRFCGIILSYALSGLAIGLIKMIPVVGGGGGPPEDMEPGDLERYFASYLFSQFTDSIPIMGSDVTAFVRQLITGEKQLRMGNNIPLANYGLKLANDVVTMVRNGDEMTRKQFEQAVLDGAMTLGLATGTPMLAGKEAAAGFFALDYRDEK